MKIRSVYNLLKMADEVQTFNPSDPQFEDWFLISIITVNMVASLFDILINLSLMCAICKLKLLKKISYRFIIALCISDTCIGAIVQPLLTARLLLTNKATRTIVRLVYQFFAITFCNGTGMLICTISLDRYIHMRYLQRYSDHMSTKKANALLVGVVLSSTCMGVAITIAAIKGHVLYVSSIVLVVNFVALLAIAIFYTRAYLSIKKRLANTKIKTSNVSRGRKFPRPDLTFAKGMLLILISLIICYIPYLVIGGIVALLSDTASTNEQYTLQMAFYWSLVFTYFVSFINAMILFIFDGKLKSFAKAFFKRTHRPRNQETSEDVYQL